MSSSRSCTNRAGVFLSLLSLLLSGCAHGEKPAVPAPPGARAMRIVVLPLENLTRAWAPLGDIRQHLIRGLRDRGYSILDDDSMEIFMARHRMRWTGGVDEEQAKAFREETGAEAVLVTSLETYKEISPPKITLVSRMVATGREPWILWMEGAALSGDDSPGILGLGLIEDPVALREKAIGLLLASLDRYRAEVAAGRDGGEPFPKIPAKFAPEISYKGKGGFPEAGRRYSIAVVPFTNLSERPTADQVVALNFVLQLTRVKEFRVLDPGVVRQRLLNMRIIMPDGPSLADANLLFNSLDTDLILSGKVHAYSDYEGWSGDAKANFSVVLMERENREIVWYSKSNNKGSDTVVVFDWGKVNSAFALLSRMTGSVAQGIVR